MPTPVRDLMSVPRLEAVSPASAPRRVAEILTARTMLEGAGFQVRRPLADFVSGDPFLLLDHLGAVEYAPGEARGAPDHPHRGFETVTYIIDGAIEHRDSTGGGGVIADGATQWMTAGSGIVHSEMPPQWLVQSGGLFHGVQLWVNLPRDAKWVEPRYQDIAATSVTTVASTDGASLVRLIAGRLGAHVGPGHTHTPITYAHATVAAGSRLEVPWNDRFTAMVYALAGRGSVGSTDTLLAEGQLARLTGRGHLVLTAAATQDAPSPTWEILLLGGVPIREPVAHYGPFVMNTHAELAQAVADYQAGRMGRIPPRTTAPGDERVGPS